MSNSTPRKRSRKSSKKVSSTRPKPPRKDFPLYAHPSGHWACKSAGRFYYLGRWGKRIDGVVQPLPTNGPDNGADAALAKYTLHYADIMAGRPIEDAGSGSADGLLVKDLCNKFLTDQVKRVDSGDLSARMLMDYRAATDRIINQFGKERPAALLGPQDFAKLIETLSNPETGVGPVRRGNEITRIRAVFKHAVASQWMAKEPTYGPLFKKPAKKTVRAEKRRKGAKLFEAAEVRALLAGVKNDVNLTAMVLLGINVGFGNADVAGLQLSHLKKLAKGWIEFPRPKTEINRRCPLWGETAKALKAVLDARPSAKNDADADCVFLTPEGTRYVRIVEFKPGHWSRTDDVSKLFGALLKTLKINGREGLGFYSLRHTFATIGLRARDRDAVKLIMGHAENDMLAEYDETGPLDERLSAVTNCVRDWLFVADKKGGE
jgi:integrase